MALSGLKKSESSPNQKEIDNFIQGASQRIKTFEQSQQKYKRLTFSLTDDVSQDIDNLVLTAKVARANRSIVIKAAINYLKGISEEELHQLVLNEVN